MNDSQDIENNYQIKSMFVTYHNFLNLQLKFCNLILIMSDRSISLRTKRIPIQTMKHKHSHLGFLQSRHINMIVHSKQETNMVIAEN